MEQKILFVGLEVDDKSYPVAAVGEDGELFEADGARELKQSLSMWPIDA